MAAKRRVKKKAARSAQATRRPTKRKAAAPAQKRAVEPQPSQTEEPAQDAPVRLEDFLTALQKSVGRAAAVSNQAAKSESEFAEGERPAYVIDGLDVDLSAGISLAGSTRAGALPSDDRVMLQFDAPGELRSRLRFRVETRAVEILSGAKLELADLDPLREGAPRLRMRVWLVDDHGVPVPNYPVTLHFARAGDKHMRADEQIVARTDVVGRIDFWFDTDKAKGQVKIVGVSARKTAYMKGSGRKAGRDEFYVWATCDSRPTWERIAEATAPRPPHKPKVDEQGRALELSSQLLRMPIA